MVRIDLPPLDPSPQGSVEMLLNQKLEGAEPKLK